MCSRWSCRYYFDKTGRRITFEYSLVAGVNDSKENAQELAGRLLADSRDKAGGSDDQTVIVVKLDVRK